MKIVPILMIYFSQRSVATRHLSKSLFCTVHVAKCEQPFLYKVQMYKALPGCIYLNLLSGGQEWSGTDAICHEVPTVVLSSSVYTGSSHTGVAQVINC